MIFIDFLFVEQRYKNIIKIYLQKGIYSILFRHKRIFAYFLTKNLYKADKLHKKTTNYSFFYLIFAQ